MTKDHRGEDAYDPRLIEGSAGKRVIVSGCSGGGKSALMAELERRGFAVHHEAGRQVVKEQLHIGGDALPWADAAKFIELTVSRTMHAMIRAGVSGELAFFDRGIIDQISGADVMGLPVAPHLREAARLFRRHGTVFLVPPWREIYRRDAERRHGFEEAAAAYGPLRAAYEAHGYDIVELPKTSVAARADLVIAGVGADRRGQRAV